jgi:hypothetical protein
LELARDLLGQFACHRPQWFGDLAGDAVRVKPAHDVGRRDELGRHHVDGDARHAGRAPRDDTLPAERPS